MKTPDKIKKGLEHCTIDGADCTGCTYRDECMEEYDVAPIQRDALAYIKQLEDGAANMAKIIESAYKQRDAAIEDLRGRCFACVHAKPHEKYPQFNACQHLAAAVGGNGARECEHWQWRRVQE